MVFFKILDYIINTLSPTPRNNIGIIGTLPPNKSTLAHGLATTTASYHYYISSITRFSGIRTLSIQVKGKNDAINEQRLGESLDDIVSSNEKEVIIFDKIEELASILGFRRFLEGALNNPSKMVILTSSEWSPYLDRCQMHFLGSFDNNERKEIPLILPQVDSQEHILIFINRKKVTLNPIEDTNIEALLSNNKVLSSYFLKAAKKN